MKGVFKTLAVLFIATCVFGNAFAGGKGQSSGSDESKSIVWLSQGPGLTPGQWEGLTKPILEQYKRETGVTVRGEFYTFNDLFQVIEVKIASGSRDYDVISVDVPMVAAYATRGYLEPMDRFYTDAEKRQFIPSALAAGSRGGVFYAPPMNTSSQLLWYNKGLLDQAGVKIRDSSVTNRLTYEEVVDYAKKALTVLDPNGRNGIAGLMFQQVSRTYQMCAVPNSMGEKSIGDDGFMVEGVINNPGWVKAMTWYQDLYKNGLALRGYNADEVSNLFNSGKVLFMIGGTWTPGQISDTSFGYAPVPAFRGFEGKVGSPTGSWHFGINKASTKKDLAGDFIKWMTLREGNTLWLKANNDVPSTQSAISTIQNDPNASPIMKIAAYEAANTAVPRALTPGYPEYSTIIDGTLEDIRNGSDVKQALDNAVRAINSALAKYKR
ncbi:MAG: extracellular solute-binding protein [Treponema sp.]|jgi:ABC-type glycerol-3-phosphate transport system substrate-binding protein|nr:extracellular solute-binding protein [Treponema sp.]